MAECISGPRDSEVVDVAAASGVDTCWYDLVEDDEFILVLARLALRQGAVYDIGRFAPARFAAEGVAS